MTEQAILKRLAGPGRKRILEEMRVDSCIATVRVAVHVLRRLGYRAWAVPVTFQIVNRVYRDLLETEGPVLNDAQAQDWKRRGAYIVAIDGTEREGHFNGHVIVKTEGGWLADLSLDQANRPAHQIVGRNWVRELPEFPGTKEMFGLEDPGSGSVVEYWIQERPASDWEWCPDWKGLAYRDPIVDAVLMRVTGCPEGNG